MTAPSPERVPRRVSFHAERIVDASPQAAWSAWTTPRALQAWWGPEDVVTTVEACDVRVGGRIAMHFAYAGTAHDARWRDTFRAAGIPIAYRAEGSFTEVVPLRALAFEQLVDFGTRAGPMPFHYRAEFRPVRGSVRVILAAENSSNAHWSALGQANLGGQLLRMERYVLRGAPDGR